LFTQFAAIPITVRQLEAIIRLSESLAKMTLSDTATEGHVTEAINLFKVRCAFASLFYVLPFVSLPFSIPMCAHEVRFPLSKPRVQE
jgi:hypothetical protein